jgi:hypothetical protein
MMAALLKRGEALARGARQRALARAAERLRETARGARVRVEDGTIVVTGRGLLKRWLADPALRFFGKDFG